MLSTFSQQFIAQNSVNIYGQKSGDDSRVPPSPSFSFREMLLRHKLSEGELNESKNSQLHSMRQNLAKRSVERKKFNKPEDCQVPWCGSARTF